MHFSIALLSLLSAVASTLARPTPYYTESLAVRESFDTRDLSSDFDSLNLRDLDALEAVLERRGGQPYAAKKAKKPKVTTATQQARKGAVRNDVQAKQAANAAKKVQLAHQATLLTGPYKKPRAPKKVPKVELSKKGKPLTPPGYRADGRAKGFRLPKQPKTPKPNMVKGTAKSDKAQRNQKEANDRAKLRKQAGKDNFKDAAAAQKKTTNLPNRKDTYTANGKTMTGKDVRVAVFNSHHFANNKVNHTPKEFRNDEQGPAGSKSRPLPHMAGAGKEFPVVSGSNGYQGTGDIGTMRAITQATAGGHQFQGVIAHDESRKKGDPGFNDHFEVKPVAPPPKSK